MSASAMLCHVRGVKQFAVEVEGGNVALRGAPLHVMANATAKARGGYRIEPRGAELFILTRDVQTARAVAAAIMSAVGIGR